jgi:Fe-S-cluster-containing hydrogenase component 2
VYTLAGADCIDVAADPAVISTAKKALGVASSIAEDARQRGFGYKGSPWLMVSFNDGEDPHFRKAEFRAEDCPSECTRPCEAICPAQAISFSGVMRDRCYGCGRCLPVCPIQNITTRSYVSTPEVVAPLVLQTGVDAVEIHTHVGRYEDFRRLWKAILPWINNLKLVAISCPDGDGLIEYLRSLHELISPLPCALVWQTDGRPMSGDIGIGTTRAAVKLGQKVLAARLPGYVQLAGGTNQHTVSKLRTLKLLKSPLFSTYQKLLQTTETPEEEGFFPSHYSSSAALHASAYVAGVAYGSYARTLLAPILNRLEAMEMEAFSLQQSHLPMSTQQSHSGGAVPASHAAEKFTPKSQVLCLEEFPEFLWQAVELASSLVNELKSPFIAEQISLESLK